MSLEITRDDLTLSDDPARLDLDRICAWLAASYWAHDRQRAAIERSITGSHAYGVYDRRGDQVAFTRAVTDGVSFCWLGDVVVDEGSRGRGIGAWLVASILEHLRAGGLRRFMLATRDAHGLYARLGFAPLAVPAIYMEIDERPTRPRPGDVVGSPSCVGSSRAGADHEPGNGPSVRGTPTGRET